MNIQPLTISGRYVRLEPLSTAHVPELSSVGLEDSIWRYMRYGPIQSEAQLLLWVQELLELQKGGSDLPCVIDLASGRATGARAWISITLILARDRYCTGWHTRARGSTPNTNTCSTCFRDAQLHPPIQDHSQHRSQHALDGIGPPRRRSTNHMILPDGYFRHSVYYSIIDAEWPQVKSRLEERLGY
jgi:hypothetical protein